MAAFLKEQATQLFPQSALRPIEIAPATADDEALALGNQQRIGIEELGGQRLSGEPLATYRKVIPQPKGSSLQSVSAGAMHHRILLDFGLNRGMRNGTLDR